jgi:rhodanese-related sulfurtransferase
MTKQRRTIHQLLADARARYRRLEPREAFAAMQAGAVLIDTRTDRQRGRDGDIPGAVVIDRTVLEWRVDPTSGATHPAIANLETPLILLCAQGYSSSLAAASLLNLGACDVTDVIGGFEAWQAAGLPVGPGRRPAWPGSMAFHRQRRILGVDLVGPDGSGLFTLGASSVQTGPVGSSG